MVDISYQISCFFSIYNLYNVHFCHQFFSYQLFLLRHVFLFLFFQACSIEDSDSFQSHYILALLEKTRFLCSSSAQYCGSLCIYTTYALIAVSYRTNKQVTCLCPSCICKLKTIYQKYMHPLLCCWNSAGIKVLFSRNMPISARLRVRNSVPRWQ